jgi:sugar lactone lactonase YvrE
VWHVQLDGQQELWATLGDRRPAGITCDDRGRLFVATFSTKSGAQASLGPVLITEQGAAPIELPQPTAAKPISGLNGIVAVPGVGVYASDTSNGTIVLWQETAEGVFAASVVASDVAFANGLAYAPSTRALYVNASGSWQLLQFTVGADGALGDRRDVPVPFMLFMDGVAVDEQGDLYVADWLGGYVVRLSTRRSVLRIANPASLAFRGGTLLATDYKLGDAEAEGGLYALDLGVCGAF